MNQNKQQKNDEIDLRELLLTLWLGKWVIICVTTIFFVFSFGYIIFFQTQTATFSVEPVASYEIDHYAVLNYLLKQEELADLSPEEQTKYVEEKPEPAITGQVLVDLLMERVKNRQDLLQAVKELKYIPKDNKTEDEWELAIKQFAYSIQFPPPLSFEELVKNKSPNARVTWQIKTEGLKNKIQYKQLLELALKKSNESIRESLFNKIQQRIRVLKTKQQHKIEDLDLQIKGLREDYQVKVANRIAYLKEQAQIARQLSIAKNTIEAQTFNGTTGIVTTLQSEAPFYLRGYEAIEKELSLLEMRATIDEFIPELLELNKKRRELVDDKLPQRLTEALNVTNIAKKERFISATIDMDEVKFERNPKSILLLALSIFVGCLVGIAIVFIRDILRGKQTNES